MKFTYDIAGMHCASCVEKIKTALSPHLKVIDVTLNPPRLKIESEHSPSLKKLNTYIAEAGAYQLAPSDAYVAVNAQAKSGFWTYYPIYLIAAYIIGVATLNNFHAEGMNWHRWMNQFMAGFFLVFSAFKFLDIRGFAEGYSTYDLLAKRWYNYGFVYPFLELGLGILYLTTWFPVTTNCLTVIIMGFSSLGVINSLMKKQTIVCACLGTILNVPLSSITLVEDLTMVVLAALALVV